MMSEIDENIQKVESVGSVLLYNWEQLPDSCIFLYLENLRIFLQNKKLKRFKIFSEKYFN